MSEYRIQKIGVQDFSMLIPLMKDCFGMEVNIEYFHWKYIDNPAGHFIGFVAIEPVTNEVAAYYGVIPQSFIIEDKERIIYQSCDTMTHSGHRRKGLFQKLAGICYQYLKDQNKLFIIGFGGAQSTPGFLKFGWVKCFDIQYYFFPRILSGLQQIFFLLNKNKNYSCIAIDNLSKIKHLLYNSNANALIHSVKTESIYKWRISNPMYKYNLIGCINEKNNFIGYACYYITGDKIFLFDYYFETPQSGRIIMRDLNRKMADNKIKGLVAFCQQNSQYSRSLKKAGFINNPFNKGPLSEKTPFIFYAAEEVINNYNDPRKWLINSFEHDAV